jgi:predicted nucleotidyltransferase
MNTYNIKLVSLEPYIEYTLNIAAKSFDKAYKKIKKMIKHKKIQFEIHKIHKLDKIDKKELDNGKNK